MCVTAFSIRLVYVVTRHQLLYKFARSGCVVGSARLKSSGYFRPLAFSCLGVSKFSSSNVQVKLQR